MSDVILNFIKQFRVLGAEKCFAQGMCYWFAEILAKRFHEANPTIVYDVIDNHFGCEIEGRVYDITGEVTNSPYYWEPWASIAQQDSLLAQRIKRDCIDKITLDN